MHTHAYLAAWNGVNELRNRLNETPSEICTYSRRFIFLESLSLSGALSVTSSLDLQTDRGMQHVKNASTQDKLSSVVIIHSGPPSRSRQARTFGASALGPERGEGYVQPAATQGCQGRPLTTTLLLMVIS